MNRFYGVVGYGTSVESPAGVWSDHIVEHKYMGDVVRNSRRLQQGEGLNSDISVGNSISVVADPYALENYHKIKYCNWNGVNWNVDNVEVKERRLILDLGEVYNGPTSDPPDTP